jgi:protein TonB
MLSNNEQNERKSRIAALAGTILFHALILVVLLILAFHTYNPLPSEEGVEVNLDYAYLFKGDPKPEVTESVTGIASIQKNTDESSYTESAQETPVNQKKKTVKPTPQKSRISIIETPEEYTIIHRKPNTDKITKISTVGNQVINEKQSIQPKPNGTSLATDNAGIVNIISYDLGGRGARILPKPTFNSSEEGKIVVSVKVNIEGKVTYASAGAKGTTISEINLLQQAESAARKTIFAPDPDAPDEQRGTITYKFIKQK